METKKTIVIGASPDPDRYSYKAVSLLRRYEHPVEAIGIRSGSIKDIEIQKGFPQISDIHTVSLYIGAIRQPAYYKYILELKPKRIIFNPGTENPEFEKMASDAGITIVEDCTLVMLNSGIF